MKLAELQPNVEYLQMRGKYRKNKVKFTADSLAAGPSKAYSSQGLVLAQVWEMDWNRDWRWTSDHIPLGQIKMTWAEWEIEEAKQLAEQRERTRNYELAGIKRAEETKALREFLSENREALADILGNVPLYTFSNRLEVKLDLETLARLIERVK